MDEIIVTMVFSDYTISDFELPVKLVIGELKKKIIESIAEMDNESYGNIMSIDIKYNGMVLDDDKTLEDYGIWDGSYLSIVEREVENVFNKY